MTEVGRPTPKPKPPRVPIWVTERELELIAAKFDGFSGSLADAISDATREARLARTQHNRAMRHYRHARRDGGGNRVPVDWPDIPRQATERKDHEVQE